MSDKYITDEGKAEILKIAFLNEENSNSFSYCALGELSDTLASKSKNKFNFQEFTGSSYHREKINKESLENNTLKASCIFEENNYNDNAGKKIGEIALCNQPEGEAVFFAFSEVPNIIKNDAVSLKYTWIISIE